jgi:DNA-binding transcriptional MerR regulator
MSRQRSLETIETAELVSIGELVRLTGVRYSTLKYYTEEGMLDFVQLDRGLTRRYDRKQAVERIALIRTCKAQSLTIPEIQNVLATARAASQTPAPPAPVL